MSSPSPEIAELKEQIRKQQQEIVRISSEILRLRRGEYICASCGLRKNSQAGVNTNDF